MQRSVVQRALRRVVGPPLSGPADVKRRRSGSQTDCLIAAIALRYSDPIVLRDADFEVPTPVSDLRTIDLP